MLDMRDIKGRAYKQLIDVLFQNCDTVKWRVMDDFEETEQLFASIQIYCLDAHYNMSYSHPTKEYAFQFNYFVKQYLDRQESLFSWSHPTPEDLAFYKEDECLFWSCTHERQYGGHESLLNFINAI